MSESELHRRCFILAYTEEYAELLDAVAEQKCPLDLNWINEDTLEYVFSAGRSEPNFMSWAAYRKYNSYIHSIIDRKRVLYMYRLYVRDMSLEDEPLDVVFKRDPFASIVFEWNDMFKMCLSDFLK